MPQDAGQPTIEIRGHGQKSTPALQLLAGCWHILENLPCTPIAEMVPKRFEDSIPVRNIIKNFADDRLPAMALPGFRCGGASRHSIELFLARKGLPKPPRYFIFP